MMKELSQTDLKILQYLWVYLQYDAIFGLLDGLGNGRVEIDFIAHMEKYSELRRDHKFQLVDVEIEALLNEFDLLLEKMLERGSNLFDDSGNGKTVDWRLRGVSKQSIGYKIHLQECEMFVENLVRPTWRQYQQFIDHLKKRGIYQKIAYQNNELKEAQKMKIIGRFYIPRWFGWLIWGLAILYGVVQLFFSSIWLSNPDNKYLEPAINLLNIIATILFALSTFILGKEGELTHLFKTLVQRINNHTTLESERTRQSISNQNSIEHGLELLKNGRWSTQDSRPFYCLDDASWTIVREDFEGEFSESWINNIPRPDRSVKKFNAILKHNNTEIAKIIFVSLDGHRIMMPIPDADYGGVFYYCENSLKHLMYNRVRYASIRYDTELKVLAQQAKIDWRIC